jgi:nucleoside-diphosphate-sugar epimerase
MTAVILGCGYTGRRVAARLVNRGLQVIATTRHPDQLVLPGVETVRFDALESMAPLSRIEPGAKVLYSIPTLDPDRTNEIVSTLGGRPSRVVYLSTTGVYGAAGEVDELTPAGPDNEEGHARMRAEHAILSGPWPSIVLRLAAIYGPARGVHVRIRQGTFRLSGDGSNYVSRIYVDDLATHVEAALFSDAGGAWPVADECPATSREIAQFCTELLKVPMPANAPESSLHHTQRSNRRVDGSAVRTLLGVSLKYPTYREGIRGALREERNAPG